MIHLTKPSKEFMKKVADVHNYGTAVHIGATVQAVEAASVVILAILSAPHADEETKRCALITLKKICSVNGATVSNCNFLSGPQQDNP